MDRCELCVDQHRVKKRDVQCKYCRRKFHSVCLGMSPADKTFFSNSKSTLACKLCAFSGGSYDAGAALVRLTVAQMDSRRSALIDLARSERRLLEIYQVQVPASDSTFRYDVDETSKRILHMYDMELSKLYTPVQTHGDGNCLYRAVSFAISGTQQYHLLLRLQTTIELILNRTSYDSGETTNNFLGDMRIVTSSYNALVSSAMQEFQFAEMAHLYALSAATGYGIQSHFPSPPESEMADAFSRLVLGRQVGETAQTLHIMWSCMKVPVSLKKMKASHFVPLMSNDSETQENVECSVILTGRAPLPLLAIRS